jgi:uncharacterized protein YjiS (DUF1127 family)
MTHTAHHAAGVPIFSGIASTVRSIRAGLAETARRNRAYHRTFAQLDAMTDRDLADIGITRFMIGDVAAEAAARV